METITRVLTLDDPISDPIYAVLKETLFFDIETTGLGHYHRIMLLGMVNVINTNQIEIIQLFDDTGTSEYQILSEFIEILRTNSPKSFITFNGDAFDIPFINARMVKHSFNYCVDKLLNIDLLKIARKNKAVFPGEKLNLKSIENYLGIQREDQISGAESILQYKAFLETQNPSIKDTILMHNFDDLKNMVPLSKLLEFLSNKEIAMLSSTSINYNQQKWYLRDFMIKNNTAYTTFSTIDQNHLRPISILGDGYEIELNNTQLKVNFKCRSLHNTNHTLFLFDANRILKLDMSRLTHESLNQYVLQEDHTYFIHNINTLCESLLNKTDTSNHLC